MKKMALIASVIAAGALSTTAVVAQQQSDQPSQQDMMSGQQSPSAQSGSTMGGQPGATSGSSMAQPSDRQTTALNQNPDVVRQVQQSLNQQGYEAGSVDGVWGEQTQSALQKFQQSKGMQASGQLDEQTLAALGVDASAAQFGSTSGQPQQQGGAATGQSSPSMPQGTSAPPGAPAQGSQQPSR